MQVYVGSILLYFGFFCVSLIDFAVSFCFFVPAQVIAWRTVSEMTYNVSSGTLNLITHSILTVDFVCRARFKLILFTSVFLLYLLFLVYFAAFSFFRKVKSFFLFVANCSLFSCMSANEMSLLTNKGRIKRAVCLHSHIAFCL